jgi:signal transduction histidine kinase
MRRSLVKLVVVSVLACWAAGFIAMFLYARSLSWTDERARSDGVFLAHEILERTEAQNRAAKLSELQQHFSVSLSLLTVEQVEQEVGSVVEPGARIPHKVSPQEEWYFLVFEDGTGALAAGPVNPGRPQGIVPIGVILLVVGLPLLAGLLALIVERRLVRVERASKALAAGDLTVRVDARQGSSDELAASFNAMAERVETLIRSRDELVQAVSHELGSPLSRIRFHVELLENQPEEKRTERLEAMSRELDALDALVAELLRYVQSDEIELDRKQFDPRSTLRDLAELARLEAPQDRKVQVEVQLSDEATVYADPPQFQRAVENLLRNATRYARSQVLLEITEEPEHVRVVVHDNGPGIPQELHEKVKIPFFRLEEDRGRETGGVGLGLAIVSRILDRHGGHLTIADSPLGGAAVATLWPKAD